ncbi:MFS transporter-like protein 101 [Elsinoe australis]|uniref:MFS transporter-like protein 101 n=1 Tax=Elsinoe australis TaxID=40998 RepID=A0A4U7AUP4_9PEZI|nr:MFS transporter-like protein 101 [Elsinoe australis]
MIGSAAGLESRSLTVFTVTLIVSILATIFVFFRFLSRVWIVKRVTLDDYIMAVAWAIAFGLAFAICYGATVGLGRHEVDVPAAWQPGLRQSQFAFSILYQPALMAEKTSILVFYLSLSKSNKIFRWATIATLLVVNCVGFALTMFTAFQCSPPSAAYKFPRPVSAQCTDVVTIYLSSSPVNIITDLAILLLPMPILTGMRLPRKQKIILVITFSFGAFVAIVDVVRVAYLQNASTYRLTQIQNNSQADPNIDLADFSWYASLSFMWTAIEVNVGIMCACVPGLKPLVSKFAPKFIHDTSLQTTERTSSNHTAEIIEQQRMPSWAPDSGNFQHRDFAPLAPAPTHRNSLRPQPLSQDSPMDMMQFLTTPDMAGPRSPGLGSSPLQRTDTVNTANTNTSRDTHVGTPTFFDFVNMQGKKSMVQMTNRESVFPISMVTILFFVWGFEYGLLDVLNRQFQTVARQTAAQNVGLHSAYFAGYFVGSLSVGRLVLKKWGFKACYNVGLAIYACGTLIFWVAAVLTSFPAYVIVNFIVGVGLSVLEAGANPFITLCGPQQYAEIRLNLSQGFQAIGTIVAPLIANKAFTKYTNDAPSLISTQWAYLGIALFTIALAFAYYYVPLPEATDAELEDACERMDHAHYATISFFGSGKPIRIIWPILALGVIAQFCYVGAQEVYSTNFDMYTNLVHPETNVTNYMSLAHTAFAISRFVAAFLGLWIKPRILLLFFFLGSIVFSSLTMNFSGDTAIALLIVSFFFEGPLFSLIFAQSLRGMGKHTKTASVILTAAIGGGALFPALSFVATEQRDARHAMAVAVAAFAGGTLMPLALNLIKPMRKVVDPIWKEPRLGEGQDDRHNGEHGSDRRMSQAEEKEPSLKKGLGILGLCKRDSSGKDSASWRERQGSGDTTASHPEPAHTAS